MVHKPPKLLNKIKKCRLPWILDHSPPRDPIALQQWLQATAPTPLTSLLIRGFIYLSERPRTHLIGYSNSFWLVTLGLWTYTSSWTFPSLWTLDLNFVLDFPFAWTLDLDFARVQISDIITCLLDDRGGSWTLNSFDSTLDLSYLVSKFRTIFHVSIVSSTVPAVRIQTVSKFRTVTRERLDLCPTTHEFSWWLCTLIDDCFRL